MLSIRSRDWINVVACGGLIAGCAADDTALDKSPEVATATSALIGDALPGTDAAGFAAAKAAFQTV